MARTIAALKREGMTVLLSEQNLYFAHALADRAYVIEGGRIRYQGSMDALMANDTVRRTYLTV
jgi:branched-chain amino acid transport system ATP-binding protein